jgi:hypothetical protein
VSNISNHLKEAFGLQVPLHRMNPSQLSKLPVYLRGGFDFWAGRLLNHKVIFAQIKERGEMSPSRLKKQSKELSIIFQHTVIFVLKELESWNRGRLIEQNVSFIEPGRQIYVPELLLQLNNGTSRNSIQISVGEKLGMVSQAILLYKLISRRMEPLDYAHISNVMDCSLMTVSRSMRELAAAEFVTIEEGKPNLVHFNVHGKELWDLALPLLSSPVKTVWRSDIPFTTVHVDMKLSGETALAHYTMLSKGNGDTFAVGKKRFDFMKIPAAFQQQVQQNYGDYRIQVWDYDPDLVSQNFGGVVDRLSLYLSMKDQIEDERMEAALQELLNKMEW